LIINALVAITTIIAAPATIAVVFFMEEEDADVLSISLYPAPPVAMLPQPKISPELA
jgi:predicted cobalt transporter CbtA